MDTSSAPPGCDLASQAPSTSQKKCAMVVLLCSLAGSVGLAPFVRLQCPRELAFVGIYGAALVITDLLTSLFLVGQMPARRSRGVALLAFGYLFTSIATLCYVVLFPGQFAVLGIDAHNELSSWVYLLAHGVFPLFVAGYASSGRQAAPRFFVRTGLAGAALLALGMTLAVALLLPHLPRLLDGDLHTAAYKTGVRLDMLIGAAALASLIRRRRWMLLDIWLAVAMVAWLLDVGLSAGLNGQRFDVGFYAGRLYGLAASLMVLGVLAAENMSLHERLKRAFAETIEARATQKSHELLASVLQQLPEGVVVIDRDDHCVMANERAASLAGLAQGIGPLAAASEAVRSLVGDKADRIAEGASFRGELVESAADGNRRVLSVSGLPMRDRAGTITGAVVTLDDVTDRTNAEEQVRHDLVKSRALLENTPLAAVEWGADLVVRRWNRRAEELFGWKAAEVVGRRMDEILFVHADDAQSVTSMLSQLLASGQVYLRSENRNVTRDGRVLHCEWYNSAIYGAGGQLDTMFSLALDVTATRHAIEQLRDADQRKDVFIATLAHELRNPLAPIANAASLLLSKKVTPDRIEWIASMISRQSGRMARLLDDLLDVSRISRGKFQLHRESTDFGNLVREALQISMPLIETARHHIHVDLPQEAVWVDVDPLRMAQVVVNLVNNSAKYTHPGGRIEVRLRQHGDAATLTVADNGIGIEPEMLAHVFEPFVQTVRARDLSQGGLGIGLALTRGLVELHGGTIAAYSKGKDCGAEFTVVLPTCAGAPVAHSAADGAGATLAGTSILIADDNEDAAESLAQLLRLRGAHVEVAHDGEEALARFRQHPADIAILDLGMPKLGGLDVARALAQMTPRPYLLAVTGRGRNEDRRDSVHAGFDEHMTKPVPPGQLIKLLSRVAPARQRSPHIEAGL
ncbi:PAS domain S-box protein [Massilia solisilvae]|uniref:histidine kinase n=1 Tax=Massilia solisilvae TaxID=1811225 RepID=A0ABT2BLW3_9BURK|nr:PAS domain S-box protein [Massilia solisilvae]MCS0609505.1 PAS domain S-box protein [Massilia solisilvae]